jgi:catechol 2,3-dioxygenase-like lactoylglutathione lyase family enzyme
MPTYHVGRFIDHIHLRCAELAAAARFYDASRKALGLPPGQLTESYYQADELFISPVDPAENIPPTRVHMAFQAKDRATVDGWYAAALAAGGTDNGAPGERTEYHPGYYAAFVLDPDGNNIEAVFHGPAVRSAGSVEIEVP